MDTIIIEQKMTVFNNIEIDYGLPTYLPTKALKVNQFPLVPSGKLFCS